MNLDAFAVPSTIAVVNGVELWQLRTAKSIGIQGAFDYLIPYVRHPERWKKQQISKFASSGEFVGRITPWTRRKLSERHLHAPIAFQLKRS